MRPGLGPWGEGLGLMGREREFGLDKMASLEKLLRAMVAYEPAQRISAKDTVVSEWMRTWGLPAISLSIPKQ